MNDCYDSIKVRITWNRRRRHDDKKRNNFYDEITTIDGQHNKFNFLEIRLSHALSLFNRSHDEVPLIISRVKGPFAREDSPSKNERLHPEEIATKISNDNGKTLAVHFLSLARLIQKAKSAKELCCRNTKKKRITELLFAFIDT